MDISKPEFCFVTGVPGSSWSMLSHRLKILLKHDMSDISDERKCPVTERRKSSSEKPLYSHFGCYFGPHNEFGENFYEISKNYTLESFYAECRRPFLNNNNDSTKCIRSHWFAYNLDWLWDNCKGNSLFLIYKESQLAVDWWLERGGWEIKHPVYTWYENNEKLLKQVTEENKNLLRFAEEKNLKWEEYHEGWWLEKFGKDETTLRNRPEPSKYEDEKILIIYADII